MKPYLKAGPGNRAAVIRDLFDYRGALGDPGSKAGTGSSPGFI